MTRDLAPEITAFLVDNEEASAREIAIGIQARVAHVLTALRAKTFSGPWLRGSAPHARKVYKLAAPAATATGTAGNGKNTGSQTSRILALLSDRRPHRVPEIHRVVGTCRLNSRIAELRPRLKPDGLTIVCRHIEGLSGPEAYEYTLMPLEEVEAPASSTSSSGTGHPSIGRDQTAASTTPDQPSPVPLSLFEAAA